MAHLPEQKSPLIIVQGGGYRTMITDSLIYKEETKKAANTGYTILKNGGSAIDAVEKAVCVFEDHGYFNAGRGSCLAYEANGAREANEDTGQVENDAMIMDGYNMNTGAVITVNCVFNPVSLARRVMDESPHCAMSGEGAAKFAEEKGFRICNPDELKGDYPNQQVKVDNKNFDTCKSYLLGSGSVEETQPPYMGELVAEGHPPQSPPQPFDTVSAVAMDKNGHLACAMSTGGLHGKRKGRVSDASLVGCGGYANKIGAAATTGHGESIIKMTLGREVVYNMERGQNAQEAAENALKKMKEDVKGHGGVIAIDKDGNFGKACTTPVMVWASMKNDELDPESGIMESFIKN